MGQWSWPWCAALATCAVLLVLTGATSTANGAGGTVPRTSVAGTAEALAAVAPSSPHLLSPGSPPYPQTNVCLPTGDEVAPQNGSCSTSGIDGGFLSDSAVFVPLLGEFYVGGHNYSDNSQDVYAVQESTGKVVAISDPFGAFSSNLGGYEVWLAWDPAAKEVLAVSWFFDHLVAINVTTNQVVSSYALNATYGPSGLVVDPVNGEIFVLGTGASDNGVQVLASPTGPSLANCTLGGNGLPGSGVFDPSDGEAYVLGGYSNVEALSASTRSVVGNYSIGGDPSSIALDGSNGELFVANALSDALDVIDTASGTYLPSVELPFEPNQVGYDPVNGLVYLPTFSLGSDGKILHELEVVNASTFASSSISLTSGSPSAMDFDPTTGWAGVAMSDPGELLLVAPHSPALTSLTLGDQSEGGSPLVGDMDVYLWATPSCGGRACEPGTSYLWSVREGQASLNDTQNSTGGGNVEVALGNETGPVQIDVTADLYGAVVAGSLSLPVVSLNFTGPPEATSALEGTEATVGAELSWAFFAALLVVGLLALVLRSKGRAAGGWFSLLPFFCILLALSLATTTLANAQAWGWVPPECQDCVVGTLPLSPTTSEVFGSALDPSNGYLFLVASDCPSCTVEVVNASSGQYAGTVDLSNRMWGIAYDPRTGDVYGPNFTAISESGSTDSLVAIDGASLQVTGYVGLPPLRGLDIYYGPFYDPLTGMIGVEDATGNLTLVDPTDGVIQGPYADRIYGPTVADPRTGAIYTTTTYGELPFQASLNVSEIDPLTGTVVASYPLLPYYEPNYLIEDLAVDPQTGDVYVVAEYEGPIFSAHGVVGASLTFLTVLDPGLTQVIASATLDPGAGALQPDPQTGDLYVANDQGDVANNPDADTLSVYNMTTNQVVGTVPTDLGPGFLAYDGSDGCLDLITSTNVGTSDDPQYNPEISFFGPTGSHCPVPPYPYSDGELALVLSSAVGGVAVLATYAYLVGVRRERTRLVRPSQRPSQAERPRPVGEEPPVPRSTVDWSPSPHPSETGAAAEEVVAVERGDGTGPP